MRIAGILAALLFCFAGSARAASLTAHFDGVAPGTEANATIAGSSFRFDLGAFLPELDIYGDPIAGSEAYRVDPAPFDSVRVSDPTSVGYGAAPSVVNALNALDQGVLITFDAPVTLTAFSTTLDLSTFGFPGVFDIVIQDAAGHALHSLPTQQSVPGFVASLSTTLYGVSSIYLPSGAFYDDLQVATAPEPEILLTLALALGAVAAARRR